MSTVTVTSQPASASRSESCRVRLSGCRRSWVAAIALGLEEWKGIYLEDSEPEAAAADAWIRCGCGNGLFQIQGDLLVLRWSPRGGEHGELSMPASEAWRTNRICEKCGDSRLGGPIPAIDMTQPLVKELVRPHA